MAACASQGAKVDEVHTCQTSCRPSSPLNVLCRLQVANVAGLGTVKQVSVKGADSDWSTLNNSWGATWEAGWTPKPPLRCGSVAHACRQPAGPGCASCASLQARVLPAASSSNPRTGKRWWPATCFSGAAGRGTTIRAFSSLLAAAAAAATAAVIAAAALAAAPHLGHWALRTPLPPPARPLLLRLPRRGRPRAACPSALRTMSRTSTR